MAHALVKLEDGSYPMAYNVDGGVPWHGHGFPVTSNMTPKQMMRASRTNFEVEKIPAFAMINGGRFRLNTEALVRMDTWGVLAEVPSEWNPIQNETAFEFFEDYCGTEDNPMTMETAGSLKGGRLVWAMAKINNSFALFNGRDVIESYMLFTNPHVYGMTASVSLTEVRVVCANTLNLSLNNSQGDKIIRITHRTEFDPDQVKEVMGIATKKTAKYKEAAEYLAHTKTNKEDIVEYFQRIFPVLTTRDDCKKATSKSALACLALMDIQPGAELGEGKWWKPYNAVTYFLDHHAGRTSDTRLTSAWYGAGRKLKVKALDVALEMASVS